jgi:hypothetical protein
MVVRCPRCMVRRSKHLLMAEGTELGTVPHSGMAELSGPATGNGGDISEATASHFLFFHFLFSVRARRTEWQDNTHSHLDATKQLRQAHPQTFGDLLDVH